MSNSKSFKSSRRIGARISIGFGLVLALHISIAIVGHVGLERASADARVAKEMQEQAVAIVETDSVVTQLQRDLLQYSFYGHEGVAKRILLSQEHLVEQLEQALAGDLQQNQRRVLEAMLLALRSFESHFRFVQEDRGLKDRLLEEAFHPAEARVLERFQEIAEEETLRVVFEAREHAREYFLNPSAVPVREFRAAVAALRSWIEVQPTTREFEDLQNDLEHFEQSFLQIVQTTRSYLHLVKVVLAGVATEFRTLSSEFKRLGMREIESVRAQMLSDQQSFQQVSNFFSVLTIVLGVLAGWVISRGIATPLKRMTETLTKLAEGEDAAVPERDRADEIGEMARAAEVFRARNQETQ